MCTEAANCQLLMEALGVTAEDIRATLVAPKQPLTLEQALTLAYRLCESRMRGQGEMWFCGEEIRRDISDLMASISVLPESLPSPQ